MKLVVHRSLALVLVLIVAACGGEKGAVDPIPTELAAVETAAETGFDAALKADQTQVTSVARLTASTWAAYLKRASADGVSASALDAASAAIASVSSLAASNTSALTMARAFNAVSAPMARIYAVYKPPVPTALLDLDYLGRELRLEARAVDLPHATTNLDTLASQWAAFRASVVAAGGATQASQMDGTLAQARKAIAANDAVALELAAVAQAEAVDAIETLFAQLDAPD